MERTTLSVAESAEYIGVSEDLLRKEIREKRLRHIRIGRRILLKKHSLDHWMDELEEESTKQKTPYSGGVGNGAVL
ncbi:helix-turn-helix domain-containing protein [Pseudalkalibacillus decolorationis]|uniref:helix-turn-helix domain-containing protein n=1 Tax=Pseudalkalibacillus decolorationis TaxID=163879 RepID=UPI002148571A|nr:helix-turn-helix domain-containing protein [Pseudalkalibacillus decolorationis]